MSDYYDSAEGIKISRDRVLCELKDHGVVDLKEFFDDLGDKKLYSAQAVLDWLGYQIGNGLQPNSRQIGKRPALFDKTSGIA